jgi:hypothetical protein
VNLVRTALREIFGLFVDDGAFAFAILVWGVASWLALPRLAIAPGWDGAILFVGLAAILVESARRRSRR